MQLALIDSSIKKMGGLAKVLVQVSLVPSRHAQRNGFYGPGKGPCGAAEGPDGLGVVVATSPVWVAGASWEHAPRKGRVATMPPCLPGAASRQATLRSSAREPMRSGSILTASNLVGCRANQTTNVPDGERPCWQACCERTATSSARRSTSTAAVHELTKMVMTTIGKDSREAH